MCRTRKALRVLVLLDEVAHISRVVRRKHTGLTHYVPTVVAQFDQRQSADRHDVGLVVGGAAVRSV